MPKQGQYAKSQRAVHTKRLRQRGKVQTGMTIHDRDFADFVVTRFALTSQHQLSPLAAKTAQRWLQELLPRLQSANGDMHSAVGATLKYCLGRVPWQFFQVVSDTWPLVAHFCQREVPAVPLAKRMLISDKVDSLSLNQMLAHYLSQQAAATTLVNMSNHSLQTLMAQKIAQQLLAKDGQINWKQVRILLQPFNDSLDDAQDEETQKWLDQLAAL